jgi:hypothetical protein
MKHLLLLVALALPLLAQTPPPAPAPTAPGVPYWNGTKWLTLRLGGQFGVAPQADGTAYLNLNAAITAAIAVTPVAATGKPLQIAGTITLG